MNPTRLTCALFILAGLLSFTETPAQNRSTASTKPAGSRINAAFEKFWAARSPSEAEKVVEELVKTGVSFDDALRRLRLGRTYLAEQAGVKQLSVRTNGVDHLYALTVPAGYDPGKRYQMRFQLHGGVMGRETNQPRGNGEIGALAGAEQFYVLPYAWADAPWWSDDQTLNFRNMVDSIKRTYNIDENRIVIAGVSDGGTGAYYIAMRETTPFASFLPLNGFIMVLANGDIDDGRIYPNNLRNKPMFVINGGRDRLYPIRNVEPFVKHLMDKGVEIAYHPQPDGEHNTAWWPQMKDTFEKFVTDHPRDPHPDKLTWETATLDHNRAHWLVIDQLGAQPGDPVELSDLNAVTAADALGKGGQTGGLFLRLKKPGRVDLTRKGNAVEATTKGIAAFTLLLSTDKFDFSQPIKVTANGQTVFEGRVQRDVETLLRWAARDNDRTMLYGAELEIKLAR